jgi:hypothetical protein
VAGLRALADLLERCPDAQVPSYVTVHHSERLMEDGYLKWQSVIWSSMRIAVLTRKGQEAMR